MERLPKLSEAELERLSHRERAAYYGERARIYGARGGVLAQMSIGLLICGVMLLIVSAVIGLT